MEKTSAMEEKPTILIVDDIKENIHILLSLLDDYDLLVALNGAKALKLLEKNEIDLILLDIVMPGMDGYEVCRIIKSNPDTKDIPILFITAKTDEDSIERAYDAGGVDYVTKPFKPKELISRIKTHLNMRSMLKSLEFFATRDFMTGIYNRRKFFELGNELFEKSDKLFAIMMDIDKFKLINDNYGHPFGDIVIKSVTKTISQNISEDSVFGRLGGEEFAILCKADSMEEVKQRIENIRKAIENLEEKYQNTIVKVTISNGIALKHASNDTMDKLLKRADEALYEAKGTGRNRVCFRN